MSKDLDALDKALLKHLGTKTPRQIAEMVGGVTPEQVLVRKDELLNQMDVLSVTQKKQKLLYDLTIIAQSATEKAENVADEFFAGTLNTAVNAQKEILKQIENLEKYDDDRVIQLNRLRVRELVSLVNTVLSELVPYLAQRYGAQPEEIEGVFMEKLEIEAARMEDDAL